MLVFKGLVVWTEKMTKTELNPTKFNWAVCCGCPLSRLVGLPVALPQIFENHYKTGCNRLQLVLYI
jgi:hypothetical protein